MTDDSPPPSDPVDIAVVGGGMVGLTLAAALGAAGVRVAVVEPLPAARQTAPGFDGRTSAIAAGSRTILEAAGVWGGMAGAAQPILDIRVSDRDSPLFVHYDHRAIGTAPLGHIVENRAIRRALFQAVASLPAVRVHDGRRLAALDHGVGCAAIRLDDGTPIAARLVVATDGRSSPTRRAAGIPVAEWRYGQSAIVCTVRHERDHRGVAQERFLPAGPFAVLPMTGRRSSIVWTEPAALAAAITALDDAAFLAELSLRFGDYLGALALEGPRHCFPLGVTHAERYVARRLALAGDAAHAIHPLAGQGLNLGIRDVAVLAEVVVDALRLGLDPGDPAALERYERLRRFDNSLMIAITDSLNRLFAVEAAPVRLARDAALGAVNRLPALKRLFMRHAMGELGALPRLARGEAL